MKFQIGDTVKIISAIEKYYIGLVGSVVDIPRLGELYTIQFPNNPDYRYFVEQNLELVEQNNKEDKLIPISHKDYMSLSDAYDKHSRTLMSLKGEEYAIEGDFLAMENRLAGMLGDSPEYVSLVMAGKHIIAIGIILEKNDVTKIKLEKLDERIRDATNLLKIASAFIHAKQNDFSLHLGEEEKQCGKIT